MYVGDVSKRLFINYGGLSAIGVKGKLVHLKGEGVNDLVDPVKVV